MKADVKRLKSDEADQFVVTEVIELIERGDQSFRFGDFLDLGGVRCAGEFWRNFRGGRAGSPCDEGKCDGGSAGGEASEWGGG